MERITVIKACKRNDMWDYNKNVPIEDKDPIGHVMDVYGAVPESYIKWVPNKIFDKRKYPELYKLFGKDHLPSELELRCYVQKHWDEWYPKENEINELTYNIFSIIFVIVMMIGLYIWMIG